MWNFKGNTTISENFCDACIILRNSYVTIARSKIRVQCSPANNFKTSFEVERRSKEASAVFADSLWLAAETEQAQQALLRLLPKAMEQLTEAERELIRALYFDNVPVREYARQKGVRLFVIQKRRDRILAKLKKIF